MDVTGMKSIEELHHAHREARELLDTAHTVYRKAVDAALNEPNHHRKALLHDVATAAEETRGKPQKGEDVDKAPSLYTASPRSIAMTSA